MIDVYKITPEHAELAINVMEGQLADVKAIEIKPAKLTKFVSAFANAGGGEIYVGIDEKEVDGSKVRAWRGFDDVEAANAHIQALELMRPLESVRLSVYGIWPHARFTR
jgi:ATP-dependent DNA helicase RecG